MKFNVNTTTQFNKGSRYQTVGQRSHELAHSGRYPNTNVKYYSKNNVDLSMSKFNGKPLDNMLNGKTVYQNLFDHFEPKCVAHDIRMIRRGYYKRCYGDYSVRELATFGNQSNLGKSIALKRDKWFAREATNGYLKTRWLKPLRTLPLKLGTETEKHRLIHYCQAHGMPYEAYAQCIRQGYVNWARQFNHSSRFLKITNLHLNLDEAGGDHAHVDLLGLGRTKKGRLSLSFNNAVRIYLSKYRNDPSGYQHAVKGNYSVISQKFIHKISSDLQAHVSKAFQAHGLDITLVQHAHARNPNTYIQNLGLWQKSQDEKRSLRQLLNSANEQNAKLRAEVNPLVEQNTKLKSQVSHYSQGMLLKPAEAEQLEQSVESLVEQNARLKHQSASRLATNQQLEQFIKKNLGVLIKNNNYWLPKLRILKQTNQNWCHEWNEVKSNLEMLSGINRLSPRLRKALISLSNGQSNSLTEYLTELIGSEKSGNVSNKAPESRNQY